MRAVFQKGETTTNQDYFLSVRLKPAEHQQLKHLCETSGLPASTVIRKLISRTEIKPKHPEGYKELYLAVNRIGTNINQIARAVNAGIAAPNDIEELKLLMRRVEQLVAEAA